MIVEIKCIKCKKMVPYSLSYQEENGDWCADCWVQEEWG